MLLEIFSSLTKVITESKSLTITQKFDNNGKFVTKWGTEGTGDGQFEEPTGIAIDSSGNVYVVDRGNSRIQVSAPQ